MKVQPEKLFALLDKGYVKIPVPKASLQKIHAWTQRYVHAGIMEHVWEVEHAQFVLKPIVYSQNVIILEEYYEAVEKRMQTLFKNPDLRLNRKSQHSSTIVKEFE